MTVTDRLSYCDYFDVDDLSLYFISTWDDLNDILEKMKDLVTNGRNEPDFESRYSELHAQAKAELIIKVGGRTEKTSSFVSKRIKPYLPFPQIQHSFLFDSASSDVRYLGLAYLYDSFQLQSIYN